MIDTPKIVEVEAQPIALLHITVARDEIRDVMGPGIDELISTLRAAGITPAGP